MMEMLQDRERRKINEAPTVGDFNARNYKFAGTPVNFLICALCVRDLQNPHSIFSLFHTHNVSHTLVHNIQTRRSAHKINNIQIRFRAIYYSQKLPIMNFKFALNGTKKAI